MPLFAYERTEEVPTETEKFLKSKSVDEIFKILDKYKDGIIPKDWRIHKGQP